MKSRRLYNIRLFLLIILIQGVMGIFVTRVFAQDNTDQPVREYTNPDEIITLSKNMTFTQAVDILNTFAQKFAHKFIYNHSDATGPLGVSLPSMYWKEALKYIAKLNNLQIVEHPDYYEITKTPENLVAESKKEEPPLATTKTRGVIISATFFEGNKEVLRELGIDWQTLHNGIVNIDINQKAAQNVSQQLFGGSINIPELGHTGVEVNALFNTFEASNLGEVLAKPSIKVLDGQEGHIQVGQDFSIKQRDFAGNVIDRFFSVGTILTVTPHIIKQNDTTFIYMQIHAERSTAQPDPISTIVNKQTAESDITMLSGESTVIAGLYNTETLNLRKGIPFLKDLPPWFFGLRYLFGYTSKQYKQRELVVLIKAELEPSIPDRMKKSFKSTPEMLKEARQKMRTEAGGE